MKRLVPIILPLLGAILALSPVFASGRAEGAIQKTWDYADVKTVVVDADRQDVLVKEGGPKVVGRMLGDTGDEVRVVRTGDTVTLTVRGYRGWFFWRHRSAPYCVPCRGTDICNTKNALPTRSWARSLKRA